MKNSVLIFLMVISSIQMLKSQNLFIPNGVNGINNSNNSYVGLGKIPQTKFDVDVLHAWNQNEAIRIGSNANSSAYYGLGLNYRLDGVGSPTGHLVAYEGNSSFDALSINLFSKNIGVGKIPQTKFDVDVPHACNQNEAIRIGSNASSSAYYGLGLNYRLDGAGSPTGHLVAYEGASSFDALSINLFSKNIGVGKIPQTKLDVDVPHAWNQNEAIRIGSNASSSAYYGLGLNYRLDGAGNPSGHLVAYEGASSFDALSINLYNKRVGIGTSNPDAELTVNGTIHAKEVKVDLAIPADYVFTASYKLRSLNEVEQFIKTNQHLPDIPSAKEIIENGFNIGEIQNKLLQKIEELTLYVIEQQKQIEELKRQNNERK
ncbi:MAG: hypothetical protein EHM93_14345 [Bacteroidales bacterium]|nr:MAG: hypothetical protein EHM93_14345 [Bacteroidales bacterium]